MNFATMSLISLWRISVHPPLVKCSAWVIVKSWPHGQVLGRFLGSKLCLKCNPSRNSNLFRLKPNFFSGRTLGQFQALFSEIMLAIWRFSLMSMSLSESMFFSSSRFWKNLCILSTEASLCH